MVGVFNMMEESLYEKIKGKTIKDISITRTEKYDPFRRFLTESEGIVKLYFTDDTSLIFSAENAIKYDIDYSIKFFGER